MERKNYYDTIVIGAGAGGLCFGAACSVSAAAEVLILEKTKKAGTKLLMSGSGQCNVTHGGSIKEFLACYGANGKRIRSCLYKHNNIELCRFLSELGIETYEREDGKVFPLSMQAEEVRAALLAACAKNGVLIRYDSEVTKIEYCRGTKHSISANTQSCKDSLRYRVHTAGGAVWGCRNLVIASGGASYPSTGSDGELLNTLLRDLPQLTATPPRPALVPVFVENYPFSELSGISFHDVRIKIFTNVQNTAKKLLNTEAASDSENAKACSTQPQKSDTNSLKKNKKTAAVSLSQPVGDLLLTHKNFSGPVILNNSRDLHTGNGLEINFVFPYNNNDILSRLKNDFRGNRKLISTYIAENFSLPKKFITAVLDMINVYDKPMAQLSGKEAVSIAEAFAQARFTVAGTAGFKQAMATAGGISLDSINLADMQSREYPGLYFIGEVLDIDGDTGGYNLQFAYSSARAALSGIYKES